MSSQHHSEPETPLEKVASNTVPYHSTMEKNIAAPIEAHTANGPTMIAEQEGMVAQTPKERKSAYLFKRLRKELPLPSARQIIIMTLTMYLSMFLAGWNDASQGPLLPSLQRIYNVDYLVISVLWIMNFVGFLTAGLANVFIADRVGFGIAAPLGAFAQAFAYILICWQPPYPLFLIAYIFNGFGLGIQDAQVNSMVSRFPNANAKMFILHAMYGVGATVSPLVSTEFVKRVPRVTLYYAVSLGLAIFTATCLILVFRFRTEDQVVGRREAVPSAETTSFIGEGDDTREGRANTHTKEDEEDEEGSGSKMKRIIKTPAAHFMAFYLAVYVGVEVTLGGWITSFLLDERGGDENVGYVTTGYFGGISLGRVILIPVTTWLGKHNSIYIYTILCIILEIVIWTVPNLIANAVLYSIIGILLGPMYPIVMMVVLDVLPTELQMGTIGWCASLGQAGSAIMPFITGGLSNRYGTWVLQPLIIAFLGFSLILWAFVPRPKKLIA